jgi:hypothetical protein
MPASVTRAGVDASIGLRAIDSPTIEIALYHCSRGPSDFGSQQGMLFVNQLQQ